MSSLSRDITSSDESRSEDAEGCGSKGSDRRCDKSSIMSVLIKVCLLVVLDNVIWNVSLTILCPS